MSRFNGDEGHKIEFSSFSRVLRVVQGVFPPCRRLHVFLREGREVFPFLASTRFSFFLSPPLLHCVSASATISLPDTEGGSLLVVVEPSEIFFRWSTRAGVPARSADREPAVARFPL